MIFEKYNKKAIPVLREKFGYKNNLAVPKIIKVVINTGISETLKDQKRKEAIAKDLAIITGQKPVSTLAKKAISGFNIRKGMKVGMKITLRKKRMYDFLDRLIMATLPRIRDFRGLSSKAIDKGGNLTIGIKEHIIFPEISQEKISSIFGLQITIATSAKTKEEALELFKLLGFPIKLAS